MKKLMMLVFVVLATVRLGYANIIIDTSVSLNEEDFGLGYDYRISVAGGYEEFNGEEELSLNSDDFFSFEDGLLTWETMTLAHGSDFYLSSYGDDLPAMGSSIREQGSAYVGYGDFYLSIRSYNVSSTRPLTTYGWVGLNSSAEGLSLIDSPSNAMVYSGETLTVGAIPEPATLTLMGFSTLGLLFRRRRNRCLLTGTTSRRDPFELASGKKAEKPVGYVNTIKPYMNAKARAKERAMTTWLNY